jgi:transposase
MGRHPAGPNLVEGLDGPEEAKRRLKVILETVAGTRTISEACAELGISEAAFHELRKQALLGAVESLAPRPTGRPRKDSDPEQQRIHELEEQVFLLKKDLQAERIRKEIAIAMPHLLKSRQETKAGAGEIKKSP